MDVNQYKKYYSDLLIYQYRNKAKAKGHIETLVTPLFMDGVPLSIQSAFSIDDAEGVHLDTLGKYVGSSRIISGPNSTRITLSDADFRVLVKIAIIKNTSASSLYEIQSLIADFFIGNILITDNATMQINYFIGEGIGSTDLQYALVYGDYLPKPMAVQTSIIIVPPFGANWFGFRTYDIPGVNISPLNSYSLYNSSFPWISYNS